MLLHLSRSRSPWLRRYRLSVKLEASPQELRAISDHRLDAHEIFADPFRDRLVERADAARARAAALGWWIDTDAKLAKLYLETARSLVLGIRARLAFRLTVGNLVRGVVVENGDLAAIVVIERALIACVDTLDAAVNAALSFEHQSEDVLAPGTEDDTVPPSRWLGGGR